ncbi:MAG: signal peptidase II [Acidobacteriota bacterium]|nr:signal peptidase II [Acidobacteriota bacterium]
MRERALPFAVAAVVFALDRVTKWLIQTHLSLWEQLTVVPQFFNIVHAENPGVAFGLFANSTGWWRNIALIGISLAVLVYITYTLLARPGAHGAYLRLGLGFVLGGAVGNLWDRLLHGTVTDFIEVYAGSWYFPAFNIADSAISIGAGLLLLDMWRTRGSQPSPATDRA